jgi:hypothetical protein
VTWGFRKCGKDWEQRLPTAAIAFFRQRKYVTKKYFGKISPRLATGKEARDSARQGKFRVMAEIVEEHP